MVEAGLYGVGMEQQGIDISSYLKALSRRVWTILIVFVIGSILMAAVAYVLPPVYELTAKILVESQQIPEDLAQTTVRQSVAERLELIQQRLMTRENLLGVVDRLGLFTNRNDLTPSDKIDRVREATSFKNISFNDNPRYRGPTLVSAFTITYQADDPRLAARVANEFVTKVLEQNLATRSQRATETYDFFKQEVQRLSGELLDLQTQIARYKDENAGCAARELPIPADRALDDPAAEISEREAPGPARGAEARACGFDSGRRRARCRAVAGGASARRSSPHAPPETQHACRESSRNRCAEGQYFGPGEFAGERE